MKKFVGFALLLILISGCGEKKEDTSASEELEKTRINTATDIAYGIKKSAQLYYSESLLLGTTFTETTFTCSETNGCVSGKEKLDIYGTVPTAGTITIAKDGKISSKGIVINGYSCDIPNTGAITCKK